MPGKQSLTEGEALWLAVVSIAMLIAWKVHFLVAAAWMVACAGLAVVVARRKSQALERRRVEDEAAAATRKLALRHAVRHAVNLHAETLRRKRRQLVRVGDYGDADVSRWHVEIVAFAKATVARELAWYSVIDEALIEWVEADLGQDDAPEKFDENMTGIAYESHCADLLRKAGWHVRPTVASGDQGVDLIAEKNSLRVALQCKRHATPVGNKAVQEAHAGKGFAGAAHAVVVSNAGYTRAAQDLARVLGVWLLHHDELPGLDQKLAGPPVSA